MKGRAIQWHAVCTHCGWECQEANAQGLASQHAKRHGHLVDVEVLIVYDGQNDGQ